MSYWATTTWTPDITMITATSPAIESGFIAVRARPGDDRRQPRRVEEVGHPVGVDGRHDPIDEDEDVEDLDEPEVLEGDAGQVEDVRPQPDPGPEGEQEDRRGGEPRAR